MLETIYVKSEVCFKGEQCHSSCSFLFKTRQNGGYSSFFDCFCTYFDNEELGTVYADEAPSRCSQCVNMKFENIIEGKQ